MPPNASSATLLNLLAGQSHLPVTQLFHKGEVVGKGAYGSVHRGIHIGSGAVVALKIINLDIADDDVEAIQKEVALLSQLRGGETTNVTQYYGCWLDGPRVWIVMDFASGGSVRTLMKATKGGVLEERHTVIVVREVLLALSFLHKAGVIHRDIKAANVLITSQGRVVLCDFGVSALLATTHSKRATMVGTPYWMAPEVISGSLYDTKADIWSLGVTIYEMMMKTPPHSDQVPMRAFILITTGPTPRLPENTGSKEMKDFMAMCLKELPVDRLTADELSKTKWIKSSAKTPVTVLKELLSKYTGWVQQGGVRDSLALDGDELQRQIFDGEAGGNWEFDTIRGSADGHSDAADTSNPSSATSIIPGSSASFQAPRSLRMLFEDSSVPPPLSESFLRNNLGSSRQHAHGQPSLGVAASAPSANSFLSPSASPADAFDPMPQPVKETLDDAGIDTARQPNFAFPRLAAPRNEFDDSTAKAAVRKGHHSPKGSAGGGMRRSPSPLKDIRGPPTPPLAGKSVAAYRDMRNAKGLADLSIPPATSPSAISAASTTSTESTVSGKVSLATPALGATTNERLFETPSRPSTAMSYSDDVSPKSIQPRPRNVASPMNFQFPPPSGSRSGKSATPSVLQDFTSPSRYATPLSRPHTPSNKDPVSSSFQNPSGLAPAAREPSALNGVAASSGLTPPKLVGHHQPATRSMDSQHVTRPVGQPLAPLPSNAALAPPLGVRRGSGAGSQSDSEALGMTGDVARLAPGRLFAIRRQASMEVGLSMSSERNGALRDHLQSSAFPGTLHGNLSSGDLLHSPPSTASPATRYGQHVGMAEANGTMDAAAASLQALNPSAYASSSQTSSTSTNSASTSISSTTSMSTLYGPPVRSFDYGALLTADDVHGELAKVVEDLATWLGIVESGLTAVLDSVGPTTGVSKYGLGPDIAVSEGEHGLGDDSFEYSGIDEDDGVGAPPDAVLNRS